MLFMICKSNLKWMNRGGMANFGAFISMNIPKVTPPNHAKICKGFKSNIHK